MKRRKSEFRTTSEMRYLLGEKVSRECLHCGRYNAGECRGKKHVSNCEAFELCRSDRCEEVK